MSHDPHPVAAQVLADDCAQCSAASRCPDRGISTLDAQQFHHAWLRAATWNRIGLDDIGVNESRLLAALWSVQLQLERHGIPIGEVPHG